MEEGLLLVAVIKWIATKYMAEREDWNPRFALTRVNPLVYPIKQPGKQLFP
jgi:hypothetical protein